MLAHGLKLAGQYFGERHRNTLIRDERLVHLFGEGGELRPLVVEAETVHPLHREQPIHPPKEYQSWFSGTSKLLKDAIARTPEDAKGPADTRSAEDANDADAGASAADTDAQAEGDAAVVDASASPAAPTGLGCS